MKIYRNNSDMKGLGCAAAIIVPIVFGIQLLFYVGIIAAIAYAVKWVIT